MLTASEAMAVIQLVEMQNKIKAMRVRRPRPFVCCQTDYRAVMESRRMLKSLIVCCSDLRVHALAYCTPVTMLDLITGLCQFRKR